MRPLMRASVVGRAAGLAGTAGVVRRESLWKPPRCCPDPRSWAWSNEKTTCKYQLFVPFCCPTPFKYFYSEETFKQKQKTKIPHEPNRVSSEVWAEQAEHEALSYFRSDESDSDLVSLGRLSVPE